MKLPGGSLRFPAWGFLVLATLCWAGNFVFGRALVESLPPFGINLLRWVVALSILVPLTLRVEGGMRRPPKKLWLPLAVMAVSGVLLYSSLVYLALSETTSINASLINAATPILTLLVAAVLGFERLTARRLFGAAVCIAGVAWIVSRGSVETLLSLSLNRGDLVMLIAALLWAVFTVLGGWVMAELSPLTTTTLSALMAFPLMMAFGGYELAAMPGGASGLTDSLTPLAAIGILYIGVFASVVAFLAWNAGIMRMGAARGAVFLNLVPVFTAALAIPALGEGVRLAQILGGLLVLCGVIVVSRSRMEKG